MDTNGQLSVMQGTRSFSDQQKIAYGLEFIKPVSGFECHLCRVFIRSVNDVEDHVISFHHLKIFKLYDERCRDDNMQQGNNVTKDQGDNSTPNGTVELADYLHFESRTSDMLQNRIDHAEPMQQNEESGTQNNSKQLLQIQSKYMKSFLNVHNSRVVETNNLTRDLKLTERGNTISEVVEGGLEETYKTFEDNNDLFETRSAKEILSRKADQFECLNREKSVLNQSGKEGTGDIIHIKVEEDDDQLSDNKSVADRLSRESIQHEDSCIEGRDLDKLEGEGGLEERHIKLEGTKDDLDETGHDGKVISRESNWYVEFSSGGRDLYVQGEDGRSVEKHPEADVNTSELNEEGFVSERLVMKRMKKTTFENCESVGMVSSCEGGQKAPYESSNVKQFEYEDDASGIIGGFLEDNGDDDDDILILDHYEHYNGKLQEGVKDRESQNTRIENEGQGTTITVSSAVSSLSIARDILTLTASTCIEQCPSNIVSIKKQRMGVSETVNPDNTGVTPVTCISASEQSVDISSDVDASCEDSHVSDKETHSKHTISLETQKASVHVEKTTLNRGEENRSSNDVSMQRRDEIVVKCSTAQSQICALHSNDFPGEKSYSCDVCGKLFRRNDHLQRHQKTHSSTNSAILSEHKNGHNVGKCFSSDICGAKFIQKVVLEKHKTLHTGEQPYSCDVCGKRFRLLHKYRRHKLVHSEERPFACTVCGKSYKNKFYLIIHGRQHTGKRPYSCDVCEKKFATSDKCKNHKKVHSDERPFRCDICGNSFKDKGNLKIHKKGHFGEEINSTEGPFSCNICGRSFTNLRNIRIHNAVHTGRKGDSGLRPFSCEVCKKPFSTKGSLKLHQREHTGEKPYACEICNKSFKYLGNFTVHKRIHTKAKP